MTDSPKYCNRIAKMCSLAPFFSEPGCFWSWRKWRVVCLFSRSTVRVWLFAPFKLLDAALQSAFQSHINQDAASSLMSTKPPEGVLSLGRPHNQKFDPGLCASLPSLNWDRRRAANWSVLSVAADPCPLPLPLRRTGRLTGPSGWCWVPRTGHMRGWIGCNLPSSRRRNKGWIKSREAGRGYYRGV